MSAAFGESKRQQASESRPSATFSTPGAIKKVHDTPPFEPGDSKTRQHAITRQHSVPERAQEDVVPPIKTMMSHTAYDVNLRLGTWQDSGFVLDASTAEWLAICRQRMIEANKWSVAWEEQFAAWRRDVLHVQAKYVFVRFYHKHGSSLKGTDYISYQVIAGDAEHKGERKDDNKRTPNVVTVRITRGAHDLDVEGSMVSLTFAEGSQEQLEEAKDFRGPLCVCFRKSPIREQAKTDFFAAIRHVDPKWHFGLFLLSHAFDLGWAWSHEFKPTINLCPSGCPKTCCELMSMIWSQVTSLGGKLAAWIAPKCWSGS
jgi:hypothetical protein